MPALAPEPIEPVRIGRLQPLHARAEVALRCFHRQMVMIAHHDKGMQQPARFPTSLEQTRLERRLGSLSQENVGPIVTAVDDVVTSSGIFQT